MATETAAKHLAPSKYADALERAWRTLWQGFIIDALVLIGGGLTLLLETGNVLEPAFWTALAILVLKSFLVSGASYLARLKRIPKSESH